MTEKHPFDIVIVGAGPAGYVGAIRAAQLGASVAIVEQDSWGGTCLNRGCIPSKALIHAAEAMDVAREARTFGIAFGEPQVDWDGLRKFKSRAVKQLVSGVELLLDSNGAARFVGRGVLTGDGEVLVTAPDGSQTLLVGKATIIATGSVPFVPPISGLEGENIFTSDEGVDLPGPFERLAIIGAGAIGVEFAYIYSRLGCKVSLFEMLPQVVPTEDPDVAQVLDKALRKAGVAVHTNTRVVGLEESAGRKRVEYECEDTTDAVEADAVFVAVGRRAAIQDLGLEEAGVETDRSGVKVDERLQTSRAGIYAVGDCLRGAGLAHLASHEALAAVETAMGGEGHVNYDCVPACIFSHPEIATVGLREKEAREQGREIKVGTFPFAANSRAVATRQREGMVKLIAAAGTEQILGAAIVGPCASELIEAAALAVELGATASEVADSIHAHPTFAEAIHEAALDITFRPLHLPPPGAKARVRGRRKKS